MYTIDDKSSLNCPRAAGQTHNRPTWSTRHKEDNPVSKPVVAIDFQIGFPPAFLGALLKKPRAKPDSFTLGRGAAATADAGAGVGTAGAAGGTGASGATGATGAGKAGAAGAGAGADSGLSFRDGF